MVTTLAKRAMTTNEQKICFVIDHLVEALGNHSSSPLRRALILTDIDQYPGATQTAIMERLHVDKATVNRDVDWLFNYGCIMRFEAENDARTIKLKSCGYAKNALNQALDYYNSDHEMLKAFIQQLQRIVKVETPTLRDAKIMAALHEAGDLKKQDVMNRLYEGATSTENRAINKLIEEGLVQDVKTQ